MPTRVQTFERSLELPSRAEEVYHWHGRPGAFTRLVPPWQSVRLESAPAELTVGARQDMRVRVGPFGVRWRAEITEVREGEAFQDVQISGPFASWKHTHTMQPSSTGSVLRDEVDYRLPLGALGRWVAGRHVRRDLERLFAYRHRITEQDLARHGSPGRAALDVLVTGSSGLVGSALCAFLTTGGHGVRRLVRRQPEGPQEYRWDPNTGELDPAALDGVDAVVHLAGENIAARRWSRDQKERIRSSRIDGTRSLAEAMARAHARPATLVSASAVGFYGDRGEAWLDEESAAGSDFLADVAQGWERAADVEGVRCAHLRFGVILSAAGGALAKMLPPFRLGAGGRLGSGRQWMSWVALDDVLGAIHHVLFTEDLQGPINVVAPEPATNADFTRTLGRVLRRPTFLPVPAFAARAAFGEMAQALLLSGQRVAPKRLEESGYRFSYPTLEGALRHQLGLMP